MMNKYCFELLNAINQYDGSSNKTDHIRKLICYISENKEIEKTKDVEELLFEASEVIRVFGYNKLNGLTSDKVLRNNDFGIIKAKLIDKYYRAESDRSALLDKQQKEILNIFNYGCNRRIFVSAPTSFGKTHILKEVIYKNSNRYKKIVLIFPTIALLTENMESISEFVERHKLNYKVVNSFSDDDSERVIYILTPERAIMIFEQEPKIHIDFFFFDEVYKIDEDFNSSDELEDTDADEGNTCSVSNEIEVIKYSRAVAFRLVLYFLAKNTKEFYLAGPYINLERIGSGMKKFMEKFNVMPIQINTEATLKTFYKAWDKTVVVKNEIEGESRLRIEGKYNTVRDKIKTLCDYIEKYNWGQTLVYCSRPDYAVKYAKYIANKNETADDEIRLFIDHLKNRYSVRMKGDAQSAEEWSIIKLLRGEIGVHHGKLPKYIQKEMLRLFNNSHFQVLFCTSTLIEGVNTEAKNIIVSSKNIRNNNELTPFDIKNIIGRAGRYYHHFLGRVFFIEDRQEEILYNIAQELNFPLFDNVKLSNEDIDNVAIEDLAGKCKDIKLQRDMQLNKKLLPDSVFVKNRLFDRLKQEKLLMLILDDFNNYRAALMNVYLRGRIDCKNIKVILKAMLEAEIISEKQFKGYFYIVQNYVIDGMLGLINYEINFKEKIGSVDNGYAQAFSKEKTVIEYTMPKYIILIQALYNYACEINNNLDQQVDLSNLTRFFETGVESEIGQYLVERGMPAVVIRKLENKILGIKGLSVEDGMSYLRDNKINCITLMDNFEKRIFYSIVG